MVFNEYCTLNLVEKVQFVNALEEALQHDRYDPNMFISFVGTKEEGNTFKGVLVSLGYSPIKVECFDDVHTMFNTYGRYSVRTHFFSTQEHIEKSGILYHTW